MKKWMKRIGIGLLIVAGIFLLATVGYILYLLFAVVIPMSPDFLYSFLKI